MVNGTILCPDLPLDVRDTQAKWRGTVSLSAWYLLNPLSRGWSYLVPHIWYHLTRPAGSVIRGSPGDLLLRTKWGEEKDRHQVQETTCKQSEKHQGVNCISQAQGLNAQAKGEVQVLISRRGGTIEIFLLATTRGSRNLVVSGYILRSGHPVLTFLEQCVLWPAFDHLFFWGGQRGPFQRSGQ